MRCSGPTWSNRRWTKIMLLLTLFDPLDACVARWQVDRDTISRQGSFWHVFRSSKSARRPGSSEGAARPFSSNQNPRAGRESPQTGLKAVEQPPKMAVQEQPGQVLRRKSMHLNASRGFRWSHSASTASKRLAPVSAPFADRPKVPFPPGTRELAVQEQARHTARRRLSMPGSGLAQK